MKRVLAIAALLSSVGCLTAAASKEIDDIYAVDVTSNADVVKSCRRIGSVTLSGYSGHRPSTPGISEPPLDYMRRTAHSMGADTLFTVNNENGDAYACRATPAP